MMKRIRKWLGSLWNRLLGRTPPIEQTAGWWR